MQARFDMAWATDWLNLFSPGIRIGYWALNGGENHAVVDAGLHFRPLKVLMASYWGENLWSGGNELPIHHLALAYRPFGSRTGWPSDLQIGLGSLQAKDQRQQGFLFTQIPLPFGLRMQTQYDFANHQGTLGLVLQATSHSVAAFGWSSNAAELPARNGKGGSDFVDGRVLGRAAGISFRNDQRLPYLTSTGTVAVLDLNRPLIEGESQQDWTGRNKALGFLDLLRRLDAMESDPNTHFVLIKLGNARCGWAMGEEIRARILRLRGHGKHVVAYMEQTTALNYFLASAADAIGMQPQGYFAVTGFAAELTFYRGLFDKLGVQPQFLRHGKYKSFEEPYTRTSLSEPARQNLTAFINDEWEHYLDVVSQARKISADSLRKVLESGEIGLRQARKSGLIDTLLQADETLVWAGGPHAQAQRVESEAPYREDWNIAPKIALVVVTGEMVSGPSAHGWLAGPEMAGSETVTQQLRAARMMPGVRAVVLRVDSPGGSAQAADEMWREVELLKQAHIPVIASVGHDAASGGYYLICGADKIVAEPNSTVGSIGVLWGKFVLKGLYEKLGLATETVKTAPHADGNSMSRSWDSGEVVILQKHMDDFYQDFIGKVADGRHKTKNGIDSLGQGQIFTGSQGLKNGLVDTLGGLETALKMAASKAGLSAGSHYRVVTVSGQSESGISTIGRDWAAARSQRQPWDEILVRWQSVSEPKLWAISPELAGWTGMPGLTNPE